MRSVELSQIDQAAMLTMAKGGPYDSPENITFAFQKALYEGKFDGFTSRDGARQNMMNLSYAQIEAELYKNIIKVRDVIQKHQYATVLGGANLDDPNMLVAQAETVIAGLLEQEHLDAVRYMVDQRPHLKYKLIMSFVSKRYYDRSFGRDALDDPALENERSNRVYQKIDEYYGLTDSYGGR